MPVAASWSTRGVRLFHQQCVVSAASQRSRASIQRLNVSARAVVTPQAPPSGQAEKQRLESALQQPSAGKPDVLSSAQVSASRRNIRLLDGDSLESTNQHRAIVAGGLALMGGLFAVGAEQIHDAPAAVAALAAVASAFLTADLISGVYHWGVDNYGDGQTPVFGSQIAGFQMHHQRPWTITERQFANNVHKVFAPALPFTAACLAVSPLLPGWASTWLSTATFFTVMSQQFHAWSHMKKTELPAPVIALQDAGLLISRKAHGAHHKAPFEGNYCIVSGFWNPILDAEGADSGAFRRLERLVHSATGVEPRCWNEPAYEWEVLEQ